ncbi:MAG: dihydroorotate dehydrogenase [Oscillospiraceae bacterium]|jgi:dihydroorotate dehydrogenase (NAD+) catalytic subunit|nr:dihydroorotate dehydrogenase [Oscillospiraceae bacterium]
MVDLSVSVAGLAMKNPLVAVSGCFGFGREYDELFDIAILGGICVKGLTLVPREGNPPPRAAETPGGMLNSIGLQNPGIETFLRDELPFLRKKNIAVIANISGGSAEEYGEVARLTGDAVDMLEVNISCPNLNAHGVNFANDPRAAAGVTEAVKKSAKVPVCVKLSPNVTDITAVALACKDAGADALSLINTLVGMRIDTETRRPVLRMNTGGLSGPAVFPVALRCVWQVSAAAGLPVIGMGGVSGGLDAAEMMMAGASAVGIGTVLFQDPAAPERILRELTDWCSRHGEKRVSDLTGSVEAY